MSEEESDEVYLRARLKGVTLERFKLLKKRYGCEHDSELIRIIITRVYNEEYEELG